MARIAGVDLPREKAIKVALDLVGGLDPVAELDELVVAQVAHAQVGADPGLGERLLRARAADAVDVGERHLEPLLAGEVDADEACHDGRGPSVRGGLAPRRPTRPRVGPGLRAGGDAQAFPGRAVTLEMPAGHLDHRR